MKSGYGTNQNLQELRMMRSEVGGRVAGASRGRPLPRRLASRINPGRARPPGSPWMSSAKETAHGQF